MRIHLLLASVAVFSSNALAWGPDGHRIVSTLAIQSLPEEVPAFVRSPEAAELAGYLGPEADRQRSAGKSIDAERDKAHFVDFSDDLTIRGGPALEALPDTREQYDYQLNKVKTNQYKEGYLPYAIRQGFELLSKDFAWWRADVAGEKNAKTEAQRAWFAKDRARRENILLHNLGTWSHFPADGANPMHVTVHYNGWGKYPNPEGFSQDKKLHGRWESAFVHANITEKDVAPLIPAYRDCACTIAKRTADFLMASHAEVVPLYRMEKVGDFSVSEPTPEGRAYVAGRLAVGAAELRDMIVDAWRHSATLTVGYPEMKVSDIEAGTVDPFTNLAN